MRPSPKSLAGKRTFGLPEFKKLSRQVRSPRAVKFFGGVAQPGRLLRLALRILVMTFVFEANENRHSVPNPLRHRADRFGQRRELGTRMVWEPEVAPLARVVGVKVQVKRKAVPLSQIPSVHRCLDGILHRACRRRARPSHDHVGGESR